MSDFRLAFRVALRHPLLTLAAIGSLALGIGANTAIFTVLNGSVLRPLPYEDPDRLVAVWETRADNPRRPVAPANFLDWRRDTTAFAGLAAFGEFSATLTGRGEAERLRAVSVSANFFDLLGVEARLGRATIAGDDRPGAARVAVLTDGLWHRLFGGAAEAVGQTLILNNLPHTIVGVLPAGLSMPMAEGAEVWITGEIAAVRDVHILSVIGRLAPGASIEQAQAQLTGVMASLSARHPDTNAGLGAHVRPLHEEVVGNIRPLVLLLQVAVAVLLLIACANVAHLLLGQAAGRQAEIAMRVAMGASRGRLVRQMVIETLTIAVPGGVAGLALAVAGVRALVAAAPAELPRAGEIGMDAATLGFTAAITLVTAAIFGLVPAWQTARTSATDLAQVGQRVAGSRRLSRGQEALVVGELALAQVLLVGAALLLTSFVQASRIDLGFASEGRVVAELNLVPDYVRATGDDGRIDPARKIRFINTVLETVRAAPGVRAAAASFTAPLTGAPNRGIRIEGDPLPAPGEDASADFQIVTPDYFRALGITLVSGRPFTSADRAGAPPVVLVNQALVERYFAARDPIGRVLVFGGNRRHEIVGVVADARYRSVEREADPTFYLPLEQNDERWPFVAFTVWTAGGPAAPTDAAALLRSAVRQADPNQPLTRVRDVEAILAQSMAGRRFNTWVIGLFAATALLLAAIGTYGVMALAVTSRTRELGVRAALGATPGDLVRMVLGRGARLTLVASALGLTAALVLTQFMAALLFNVAPRDPATFAGVAGLIAAVALVATVVPARRAMRVNPVETLRAS